MKTFKEMMEKIKEPTGDLKKACWKGYTAVGMKMKNGRKVPNCVPEEVELDEANPQGMSDKEYARHELGKGKKPEVKVGAKVTVDGGGSGVVQKIYDKELSNGQKRKFIHLKDHKGRDFHHRYYAHRVKVMEEVELDEARNTYKLYDDHKDFDKAHAEIDSAVANAHKNPKAVGAAMNKHKKVGATDTMSSDSIYLKIKRLHGSAVARKAFNEEVENLDELSKKTLGSYIKQASGGMKGLGVSAHQVGSSDNPTHKEKMWKRALKREKGISMAADKLTKEEVEQIDELSKKKLKNYITKATDDKISAYSHDYRYHDFSDEEPSRDHDQDSKDYARAEKREKGIDLARAKVNKSGKSGRAIAKVKANEEVELDEMQGDDYNQGGWNHDPYDYNKGKWSRANTLKNKEWQKVSKQIATRLADKLIDRKKARKVNEEVTLDEMSKLSDALAKIKHDFENPPADHKDAKPAAAKKPEPKKSGGMDYYPDSHGGRRYMGDSVEMDGETIAESNEENARAKVRETHSQILKKGYKYIGSEQRSVGKDDSLVTHNYLSKDGSHIHHMQYSPYTMTGKGGPHIFHKKTKFNAKLHDHLTEQCFNYFDEASPKAGKNVVPPTVSALATGGIVKEEGKDPLVSSWNKSLVKRIQGSKHPEHVKTNLLAKAKKSKSASDAELVHQELDNMHEESEGENKPLGKVMRAGDGKKKFKVYVKNAKGNTVKVGFGDPNMEIKRDDPERRKNFRARHNCDSATDRTTPRYWSCRNWRASAKVEA